MISIVVVAVFVVVALVVVLIRGRRGDGGRQGGMEEREGRTEGRE